MSFLFVCLFFIYNYSVSFEFKLNECQQQFQVEVASRLAILGYWIVNILEFYRPANLLLIESLN